MSGNGHENVKKSDLLLYAVTDRSWLNGRTLCEQVEEALRGGATFIQLREKGCGDEELLKEATEIKALCRRYRVPFVINDNVNVAIKSGADGVHVGQRDKNACEVRAALGKDKILGVTAHTVEQAVLAERMGADYLGVGAVFPTGTKADAERIDRGTLEKICKAVKIPVIAIGGVNAGNVTALKGSGVSGVAVVSAIFAAENIFEATVELKKFTAEMVYGD